MVTFQRLVPVLLSLLVTVPCLAAPPPAQMAVDVRTEPVNFLPFGSGPQTFAELGGFLYFAADDGLHGFELWRSDGTRAGTRIVLDACPGACSGIQWPVVKSAGGRVYYAATDGVHGIEPWISDGTATGTRMLADLQPDGSSSPSWFTPMGDRVVFTAHLDAYGREPWVSDGTAEGTMLLGDLRIGPESSHCGSFLATAGTVFFNADDGAHGWEVWATDGSPAGTRLVLDVQPGKSSSTWNETEYPGNPRYATALAGRYFFRADDGVHGSELWVTDGTAAGTRLVADLYPGATGSDPIHLTVLGSDVFFEAQEPTAGREIWATDGTEAGTRRVTDLPAGPEGSRKGGLATAGSYLYFTHYTPSTGAEPWRTDGTVGGTVPLGDLWPGPEDSRDFRVNVFGGWEMPDGRLLFFADDGVHGLEPWTSDGTSAGTLLLYDLYPGPGWSGPQLLTPLSPPTALGDQMLFFALDDQHGYELWATNGSTEGTRLVRDVDDQPSSLPLIVYFRYGPGAAVGNRYFFTALDDDHGEELWSSGGTPGTSDLARDINPSIGELWTTPVPASSFPRSFAPLPDRLVFLARPHSGSTEEEVWSSDGTPEGTLPLVTTGRPGPPEAAGHGVFFNSDDGFWATDGTPGGTHRVEGVDRGGSPVEYLGTTFVSAATPETGHELYRLDSALQQATLVADLEPGAGSSAPSHLTVVGDRLFFTAQTPATGTELWVSDGTPEGSLMLADVAPGAGDSIESRYHRDHGIVELPTLVGSGARAFVVADDGVHGRELWASDGTPAGTHLVVDLLPGPHGSDPQWLTDVAGVLYFTADDGSRGRELWRSDGTAAGTGPVADLASGPESSLPHFLAEADGHLYFAAFTPAAGVELWHLAPDAPPGPLSAKLLPELAMDVLPGPDSSSPSFLTVAGRRLFFYASDGVHGFEPWSMVLPSRHLRATLEASATGAVGEVLLTVHLYNDTPIPQPDAEGDELRLPLPAGLVPGVPTATSGTPQVVGSGSRGAAPFAAAATLVWNGALAAGEVVTLQLTGQIPQPFADAVDLQGTLAFDTDGDGTNDLAVPTDDPTRPGAQDPTRLPTATLPLEVPALSPVALVLLAVLLVLPALRRLRTSPGRIGPG